MLSQVTRIFLRHLLGELLMHLLGAEVAAGAALAKQIQYALALGRHPPAVLVQSLLQGGIHGCGS